MEVFKNCRSVKSKSKMKFVNEGEINTYQYCSRFHFVLNCFHQPWFFDITSVNQIRMLSFSKKSCQIIQSIQTSFSCFDLQSSIKVIGFRTSLLIGSRSVITCYLLSMFDITHCIRQSAYIFNSSLLKE